MVQARSGRYLSGKFTHAGSFDGNTLLVLTMEGVTEETDSKVERRCMHTVSKRLIGGEQLASSGCWTPYSDSVRNTGNVFVSVKFYRE